MNPLLATLSVFGILCAIMTIVWIAGKRIGKWAIVDPVWSFSIAINTIAFSLFIPEGYGARKAAIGGIALLYSIRLGSYLALRVFREAEDDPRYAKLHEDWGKDGDWKMYRFFIYQAIGSLMLCASPFVALLVPRQAWSVIDTIGIGIAVVALVGEAISDAQLKAFKRSPENKGEVCDVGLWRYSRHPNYFFQWVFWLSFPVLAIGSPYWLLSLAGPALMLWFLLKVTGIPLTEKRLLQSKGEAYREYQRRTSIFIPWIPKSKSGNASQANAHTS